VRHFDERSEEKSAFFADLFAVHAIVGSGLYLVYGAQFHLLTDGHRRGTARGRAGQLM